MKQGARVLVVTPTLQLATSVLTWLDALDADVVLTTTYESGRRGLAGHPDVLITELKLGAYNGLQLVSRGHGGGTLAIVIGPRDPYFEHDAQTLGALYIPTDTLTGDLLTSVVTCARRGVQPIQTAPVPDLTALGDDLSAYVLH